MVKTRSSEDVGATANGGTGDNSQERKQRVYAEMEEYVTRVRQLETQNRELRTQLQQQGGGGGGGSRPGSSTSASGWGSARVSSPVSKEVYKLRQEKQALENKVKEARRENQELREQFNESFEDARSKFRSQGRIHGNQMAAKKAEETSGQIAYLKDAVGRLTKTNKELEAECRRLKKDIRDGPGLREELLRAKEQQAALERNVESLQDEKENLERELEHQGERQSLGAVEEGDRPRVQELEAEVRDLRKQVKELSIDLKKQTFAEGEQERLKQEVEDLKARLQTATAKQMKRARAEEDEYEQVVAKLEEARKQVQREEDRCKQLQEELETATKAQNAAEDRVRRLEGSPSQATKGEARAVALAAMLREREGEVETLLQRNEGLTQEVEALEGDKAALEEEARTMLGQQEAERKQAAGVLAKEKKALQREIDRLKEELDEAEAAKVEAQAAAAKAQDAALERAVNAEDAAREEKEEEEEGEEGEEEDEEVQRLLEENAALQREMETYRELAASQDQQFSLVYIQEVNTQADYVVVENRTNLDISLAGWALGAFLSEGEIQYEFPEELMLSARAAVKVWWGTKNLQHKVRPTRGNLFWEESDKFDIFKEQGDQVVLMDPEGYEMSRMRIISGKRRARAGPMAGSPTPEAKRSRTSYPPSAEGGGGGGGGGGGVGGSGFGVRTLY